MRLSLKRCSDWAGPTATTCKSKLGGSHASDFRRHATDLVALAPEVIVANGVASLAPLLQATHTVPIVFATAPDPVGAGFIETMAHPVGNATGFAALNTR